jgi:hypothetical protein
MTHTSNYWRRGVGVFAYCSIWGPVVEVLLVSYMVGAFGGVLPGIGEEAAVGGMAVGGIGK